MQIMSEIYMGGCARWMENERKATPACSDVSRGISLEL